MLMHSSGLGEYESPSMGQFPLIASIASTTSSGFNIFGGLRKLFGGKSKKQKKAESMRARKGRAGSIMNAMQAAISRLPPEAEEYLRKNIETLTTTGSNGGMQWMNSLPRSIGEAFKAVNPGLMGKKRASAALRSYQNNVDLSRMAPDSQWYPSGYNPNVDYSGPGQPPPPPPPVGVPGPPPPSYLPGYTGQTLPPGFMVPTQDGQAQKLTQAGVIGTGNLMPWVIVGSLVALPFALSGPRTKRLSRRKPGTRNRRR